MNKGFCEIPIDKLVKAGWNYKENNQELAEKLANNIKRNGQIENIIVRELDTGFYEVVNGNHRLDVLSSIGFDKVFCFNLGNISEVQAKRIAIETNETKFNSKNSELESIMLEIVEDFDIEDIVNTMPFSEEEIDKMIHFASIVDNEGEGDLHEVEEIDEFNKQFNMSMKFDTIEEMEEFQNKFKTSKTKFNFSLIKEFVM